MGRILGAPGTGHESEDSAFVTVSSRGWLADDGGWGLMGRGSVRREVSGLKAQGDTVRPTRLDQQDGRAQRRHPALAL